MYLFYLEMKKVSVITPTYNRRKFIPFCFMNYARQTYPHDKIEFIIGDDGTDKVEDLVSELTQKYSLNVKYVKYDKHIPIADKRNRLNKLATGQIIVAMDDDDFYSPERISHSVEMLAIHKCHIAGSSLIHILNIKDGKIYSSGPFHNNHATNGTFAYTKQYAKKHRYDSRKFLGEEATFTRKFTEKMVQLDPFKTMLCIAHNANTFEKTVHGLKPCNELNFIKFIGKHREQIAFITNLIKDPEQQINKHKYYKGPDKKKLFKRTDSGEPDIEVEQDGTPLTTTSS
jgi:glycosyltransferase involved in cell wall biosynthesis